MSKIPQALRRPMTVDNTYWRSLDQLEDTPEFREWLEREFQDNQSELIDPVSRRTFVKLMSASLGMMGLAACRRPVEKILPYSKQPEDLIPGVPHHYATTLSYGNEVLGALVESHEGRPTKIEGNPQHPQSLGATNAFMQALVLDLYDADRSKSPMYKGQKKTWADFETFASGHFKELAAKKGEGLAILSETVVSPTLMRLRDELKKAMPQAQWFTYDPVNDDNARLGAKMAFGKDVLPSYDFSAADVIVSLDSDFLSCGRASLRAARQFARRRDPKSKMNRLYAIEGQFSVTGAHADHRLRIAPRHVLSYAQSLAHELFSGQKIAAPAGVAVGDLAHAEKPVFEVKKSWIAAVAKDLAANAGRSVVIAGDAQPPAVHALAHLLNAALGNIGKTVNLVNVTGEAPQTEQIKALAQAIDKKAVEVLFVLGGNPAYNAPADLDFAKKLQSVAVSLHASSRVDETSSLASWHLPRAHQLEAWGDAQTLDGVASIVQPLILPMYAGKSDIELVSYVLGKPARGYDLVRETYNSATRLDFEKHWRKAVHAGVATDLMPEVKAKPVDSALAASVGEACKAAATKGDELTVAFVPSAHAYDGRFANNPWLQELPDPMTKLTWDNAALIGVETAKSLGVATKDVISIAYRGKTVEAPVWVQPGVADKTIVLALGHGRTKAGEVGNDKGFNAYSLRHSDAPWFDGGVKITKTGKDYALSSTQDHHTMVEPITGIERAIVREATLEKFKEEPDFADKMVPPAKIFSLYREWEKTGHQWGMAIDLNKCTGCNGCMIACQAENNIPVVGKEQVAKGREMHWIRLDRYFRGENDAVTAVHQPVTCMQCENAPCEQVCPVTATAHSGEGLNDMAYNRCIGTRYCSNNCPYKVRRFNYLAWHENDPEVRAMQHNPNVTVRMRGVMEKCTYCVQRIQRAKIDAKVQHRELKDGDITPACAQSCPTEAITFGDVSDKNSRVSMLKREPRKYDMLDELNTKPRTSYLAKIRNPNRELA